MAAPRIGRADVRAGLELARHSRALVAPDPSLDDVAVRATALRDSSVWRLTFSKLFASPPTHPSGPFSQAVALWGELAMLAEDASTRKAGTT